MERGMYLKGYLVVHSYIAAIEQSDRDITQPMGTVHPI